MAHLIDKSALVAEIENLKENARMSYSDYADGILDVCKELLSFINTLEVKEVQEEPVNDDLERKAVGVGLRFRDELICDGVSREAAEIYAAIAQQKFMDGAKWQKEKLIEKACKFIHTPCIYVVDFNHYGGATTNYEATVEKFRKYMED